MSEMSVSEFKKHCTRILREVARDGEGVVITNRGKPVARVTPARESGRHPAWGALAGQVVGIADGFDEALGDEEWEAAQ